MDNMNNSSSNSDSSQPASQPATQPNSTDNTAKKQVQPSTPGQGEAPKKDQAKADGQTQSEASVQRNIKKLKIKVQGKEEDFDLDLDDEDKLREFAQLGRNANHVTRQARDIEKNAKAELEKLTKSIKTAKVKDVISEIKKHNPDFNEDEALIEYLAEKEMMSKLSPEEKEYLELKQEKEERSAAQEKAQKAEREAKVKEESTKIANKLKEDLFGLLKENGYLQDGKPAKLGVKLIQDVAREMADAKRDGFSISAKEAYDEVMAEKTETFNSMLEEMPDEQLFKAVQKRIPNLNKLLLRDANATSDNREKQPVVKQKVTPQDGKQTYQRMRDWNKSFEE